MTIRRSIVPLLLAVAAVSAGAAPAPAPTVTVLGDSITAGFGLPAADALPAQLQAALGRLGVRTVVRGAGLSGDTTAGGLARVDWSVGGDTALCVVELGANDYLQSVPPADTERNLLAITRRLQARHIPVLLLGGLAPPHGAGADGPAFDRVFPDVAAAAHVPLLTDMLGPVEATPALKQEDGLHPNAKGVRVMADRIAPAVRDALRRSD